jgi:hypothetical protein
MVFALLFLAVREGHFRAIPLATQLTNWLGQVARERHIQGKPYQHQGRFTDTWMKKNGQWICIASHLGVISK